MVDTVPADTVPADTVPADTVLTGGPVAPIAVALDAPDLATACAWATAVAPHVAVLKVGLETFAGSAESPSTSADNGPRSTSRSRTTVAAHGNGGNV